jgi:23S rRNA (adenine2030-N6)-methyltransferase
VETALNYRHAYHAGNFADLVKHAALLAVLAPMTAGNSPVTVIDTHGGAGAYDLDGDMARKSGEAEVGIGRLMAQIADRAPVPAVYGPLMDSVRRLNPEGGLKLYPGSPSLIAQALRPSDRYLVCELRPDDFALLQQTLKAARAKVTALMDDGYVMAKERTPTIGPVLTLIDPPFERADDYDRAAAAALAVVKRNGQAVVMIWTPLKDLETFDRFLRLLEQSPLPPTTVVEARLRPLTNPMRMNGCALVILNAPSDLQPALREAAEWVVQSAGEPGAEARVWSLA